MTVGHMDSMWSKQRDLFVYPVGTVLKFVTGNDGISRQTTMEAT